MKIKYTKRDEHNIILNEVLEDIYTSLRNIYSICDYRNKREISSSDDNYLNVSYKDLHFEAGDYLELGEQLETIYDVPIPQQDIGQWITIGDTARYIIGSVLGFNPDDYICVGRCNRDE